MKIEGLELAEIFRRTPWPYKIVMVVGSAFSLFAFIYMPLSMLEVVATRAPKISPIMISSSGKSSNNVLDASVAYDARSRKLWIAYTSDDYIQNTKNTSQILSVRLGWSQFGNCSGWFGSPQGAIPAKPDKLIAPDGYTAFRKGVWHVETPSLVYDPEDKGREFKLFAYKYFWDDEVSQRRAVAQHYGAIVYKYASDPAKEWSEERWLFSAAPGFPPAPYEGTVLLHLDRLDPSLQDIFSYSRPSALVKDGVLFMTLSAFDNKLNLDRVIMISSRDHGNSWIFNGVPLRLSDLAGIGPYTKLAGASVFEQDGQVYLSASLGDDKIPAQGAFIFAFDDLARGTLRRDPKTGAPLVINRLPLPALNGIAAGGAISYNDACNQGALMALELAGVPARYNIYTTNSRPLPSGKK